eukprot:TRINITY_DN1669_c0_g1_i1.p2 TRINITY_DN1669_c0_g1~~TRINITY_DN1669_c0_g1_i1.p2  ORF type:complete len:90 (-),score=19.04 TRINITY_DN1669_c0_g1_i1:159-428(-)
MSIEIPITGIEYSEEKGNGNATSTPLLDDDAHENDDDESKVKFIENGRLNALSAHLDDFRGDHLFRARSVSLSDLPTVGMSHEEDFSTC